MGLIARFLEDKGISTVAIYLQESMAESVPSPRMLQVKWPFGNPYGQPHKPELQAMVIRRMLEVAVESDGFGHLEQPDWPWRDTVVSLPGSWRQVS